MKQKNNFLEKLRDVKSISTDLHIQYAWSQVKFNPRSAAPLMAMQHSQQAPVKVTEWSHSMLCFINNQPVCHTQTAIMNCFHCETTSDISDELSYITHFNVFNNLLFIG